MIRTVATFDEAEAKEIEKTFHEDVNMTAGEIESWLQSDASKSVGQKDGSSESVGHQSGRRIVSILEKKRSEYTAADREHMRKVSGYIHRHRAQRPSGDVRDTPWRYSLMNWGHDPLK